MSKNDTGIKVYEVNSKAEPTRVILKMSPERAVLLFHDVNRLLSLLDVFVPDIGTRFHDGALADQAAYDRVTAVLAQLQGELDIEPKDSGD